MRFWVHIASENASKSCFGGVFGVIMGRFMRVPGAFYHILGVSTVLLGRTAATWGFKCAPGQFPGRIQGRPAAPWTPLGGWPKKGSQNH